MLDNTQGYQNWGNSLQGVRILWMYLTRIFNQQYFFLNSDPPRRPWTKHTQKVSRVCRVGEVDYGLHYISRAGDYDKLWSVRSRFTTSNCGEHGGTRQTARLWCHSVPSFPKGRDYAIGRGCRFNGRKLDDAVEGNVHVSSTCNLERNKIWCRKLSFIEFQRASNTTR